MSYCYSPLPPEYYTLDFLKDQDLVTALLKLDHPDAAWNLLWMTEPSIDAIPELGTKYYTQYKPDPALVNAVVADVYEDSVLRAKLTHHPQIFLDWFLKEDPTIYDCYEIMGSIWVDNVVDRARLAIQNQPGVEGASGNVIQVRFGKAD